jgi:hypothetical protein
VIHTVLVLDADQDLTRADGAPLSPLAVASEGVPVVAGARADATMLVRPIRLDAVAIRAPGWTPRELVRPALECSPWAGGLAEGASCVWWAQGVPVAGPIVVEGLLWNHRFRRVVQPDPREGIAIARELAAVGRLSDDARVRVEAAARACVGAWAMFVTWGGTAGYIDGASEGVASFGGSSHSTAVDKVEVKIGEPRVRPLDLHAQLAPAIEKCHATDEHVEIFVETTYEEIVHVAVTAPPAMRHCIEEAVWDTELVLPHGKVFDSTRATFGSPR